VVTTHPLVANVTKKLGSRRVLRFGEIIVTIGLRENIKGDAILTLIIKIR